MISDAQKKKKRGSVAHKGLKNSQLSRILHSSWW